MIRQFFRLLIHAQGLRASIPVGLMLGLLLEGVLLHPTVAPGLSGVPHLSTYILTAIVAGLIGGVLVEQDRSGGGHYFSIVLRTLVVTAWWPMLRLAYLHDHSPTSVLLAGAVCLLLPAAGAAIYGLILGSRRADLAAYALTATALVVYGAFLQGERVLTLARTDQAIDGELRTVRWCGFMETERVMLRGVHGSTYKFQSDAFDNVLGDGAVLLTSGEPVLIPGDPTLFRSLGSQFNDRFDELQQGAIDSLTLVELLPRFRLPWTMCFAGAFLLIGLLVDPVSRENRAPAAARQTIVGKLNLDRLVRRAAAFGLFIGLGCLAFAFAINVSSQWAELDELEEIAGSADRADIEFDGEPIVGNALRVRATRPGFSDEDITRLEPLVSQAGALDLDLSDSQVTDAGIEKLRWGDSIFALRLRNTPITPAALPAIGNIAPMLLDLRDTSIRATDLSELDAPTLEYLLITDPTFSRRDVAQLIHFKRLKVAQVEQARLSQADIDFWSLELAELKLGGIQIDATAEVATPADVELPADGPIADGPIVDVVRQYVAAIARRDGYALKTLWDAGHPTNVRELPDDWWAIRPVTVDHFSGARHSGVATLRIIGRTESGDTVPWEFELIEEYGQWKVKSERWPG